MSRPNRTYVCSSCKHEDNIKIMRMHMVDGDCRWFCIDCYKKVKEAK